MGKVAWGGFTCSIDGFIAGPDHDMSWLSTAEDIDSDITVRLAEAVGAILSGRRGYDAALAQRGVRDDLTSEPTAGPGPGSSSSSPTAPRNSRTIPASSRRAAPDPGSFR